jgi:carboxymethylenebutenolidase
MSMKSSLIAATLILLGFYMAFSQTAFDPAAPGRTNANYSSSDGASLKGYLAVPAGAGPFPAVVMIHEWWGLTGNMTAMADVLSKEGYVVLAADLYRGKVARLPAEAQKLASETPQVQMAMDLDAAFTYLAGLPNVRRTSIASLGFCFGGSQSMRLGTRNNALAAVVIFYGGGPIQKVVDLGSLAGPVLGIYGEKDPSISAEQVRGFERAMNEKGVANSVNIYPGVGHAFVKSDTYDKGGSPEAAWKQAVAFLKTNLK